LINRSSQILLTLWVIELMISSNLCKLGTNLVMTRTVTLTWKLSSEINYKLRMKIYCFTWSLTRCLCIQLVFSTLTLPLWYLRYQNHFRSSQSSHYKRNLNNHINCLKRISYQQIIKMLTKMQQRRTIMTTSKAMAITTRIKTISLNYRMNKEIRTHQRHLMLWLLLINLIINNRGRVRSQNKSNKSMMVMTNMLRTNMNNPMRIKKPKRSLKTRC